MTITEDNCAYKILQSHFIDHLQGLSPQVRKAFLDTPRHLFVSRFLQGTSTWVELRDDNLKDYLDIIYADHPLVIYNDDKAQDLHLISTISQPSFVLKILDLLDIKKGQKIFEVGTGSGWNAALMARLVEDEGHIFTTEIIPELIQRAEDSLNKLDIKNVTIIEKDGMDGLHERAPFDRMIFTAGSYDLPKAFHEQIKQHGLLIFILKGGRQSDILYLLEKEDDHFVSKEAIACNFVPVYSRRSNSHSSLKQLVALNKTLKVYPNNGQRMQGDYTYSLKMKDSIFIWD